MRVSSRMKYYLILMLCSFVCAIKAQVTLPLAQYDSLDSYSERLPQVIKQLEEAQASLQAKRDSVHIIESVISELLEKDPLSVLNNQIEEIKNQINQYKKENSIKELEKTETELAKWKAERSKAEQSLDEANKAQEATQKAQAEERNRHKEVFVNRYFKKYTGLCGKPLNSYSQKYLNDAISNCSEFPETESLADSLRSLLVLKLSYDNVDSLMLELQEKSAIDSMITALSQYEIHKPEFEAQIKKLRTFRYYLSNLQWNVRNKINADPQFSQYRAEMNLQEASSRFESLYNNIKDNLEVFSTFPCIKRCVEEYVQQMRQNACVPSSIETRILELKFE